MDEEEGVFRFRKSARHYHGDTVRVLFVLGAVVLFIAESTGAVLPLSTSEAVVSAVVLVVAAGITNPEQLWIHFVNAAIAVVGTIVFAEHAVAYWRQGGGVLDASYLFTECIAVLSIVALYFATKTVRGVLLRPHLED